jgi:hypothetical protein
MKILDPNSLGTLWDVPRCGVCGRLQPTPRPSGLCSPECEARALAAQAGTGRPAGPGPQPALGPSGQVNVPASVAQNLSASGTMQARPEVPSPQRPAQRPPDSVEELTLPASTESSQASPTRIAPVEPALVLSPETGRNTCPACNRNQANRPSSAFCIYCGLPLTQPCPACRATLPTRGEQFCFCPKCGQTLRRCESCFRYFSPKQLLCSNSYCTFKDTPWTVAAGDERWSCRSGDPCRWGRASNREAQNLEPLWSFQAPQSAEALAPVNTLGMLVVASLDGQLRCFFEEGAAGRGDRTTAYIRMPLLIHQCDLGTLPTSDPVVAGPQQDRIQIALQGGDILQLDLRNQQQDRFQTSLEDICHLLPFQGGTATQGTRSAGILRSDGLIDAEVALPTGLRVQVLPPVLVMGRPVVAWNIDRDGAWLFYSLMFHPERNEWLYFAQSSNRIDFLLGGDTLFAFSGTLVEGFRLRTEADAAPEDTPEADADIAVTTMDGESLEVWRAWAFELPENPAVAPRFDPEANRFVLGLMDNSFRICRPEDGGAMARRHEAAGHLGTPPLLFGRNLAYSTLEGYLCLGPKVASPLLHERSSMALSYANSKIFATTEQGGVYAFRVNY